MNLTQVVKNRRARLLFSLAFAVPVFAALLAATGPELSDPNTACLWLLAILYVLLYCYFVLTGLAVRKLRTGRRLCVYLALSGALSARALCLPPLWPGLLAGAPFWRAALFFGAAWALLTAVLLGLLPWAERFFVSPGRKKAQ